jgi:hypothetical protein
MDKAQIRARQRHSWCPSWRLRSGNIVFRRCLRLQSIEFSDSDLRIRADRSLRPAREEPPAKTQLEVVAFQRVH